MRGLTWVIGTILAFSIIWALSSIGRVDSQLDTDLNSVLDRAQVSADASDMLAYMRMLQANLERHGATTGHTAYVLKNPRNDLALQFQTVQRITERLEQIESLPRHSIAYRSSLDDIRGVIREMPRPAHSVLWCSGAGMWSCKDGRQRN